MKSASIKGLTLVELLVAIAIIGIVSGIGYSHIDLTGYSHRAYVREIRIAMLKGKHEATRRNRPVILDNLVSASSPPIVGYKVWVDQNRNGVFDGSQELLMTSSTQVIGGTMSWFEFDGFTGLRFNPNGSITALAPLTGAKLYPARDIVIVKYGTITGFSTYTNTNGLTSAYSVTHTPTTHSNAIVMSPAGAASILGWDYTTSQLAKQ